MKSSKYLLTVMLMVSAGLSAMEPDPNFEKINQRIKQDTAPIRVGLGLAGGFMATLVLFDIYDIYQRGLPDLNRLKNNMIDYMAFSGFIGSLCPFFGYTSDYLDYKNQYDMNDHRTPYSASLVPYKRMFKWKSNLVKNYPDLYLKHSFNTTTEGFKVAFGAPLGIVGGICAVNALSGLSK